MSQNTNKNIQSTDVVVYVQMRFWIVFVGIEKRTYLQRDTHTLLSLPPRLSFLSCVPSVYAVTFMYSLCVLLSCHVCCCSVLVLSVAYELIRVRDTLRAIFLYFRLLLYLLDECVSCVDLSIVGLRDCFFLQALGLPGM